MSEEKERPGKITLGIEELSAIIGAAVNNAIEKSSAVLANAILESKKPYIDPAQAVNDQTMRESMRDQRQRILHEIEASQASCLHLQGSNALSDTSGTMSSIVMHKLDYGDVIGICTNCQRVFKPGDPDYATEMRRKSGNRMSSAGHRTFYDTAKVITAGRKAIGCEAAAA